MVNFKLSTIPDEELWRLKAAVADELRRRRREKCAYRKLGKLYSPKAEERYAKTSGNPADSAPKRFNRSVYSRKWVHRQKFLPDLLSQDWSHLFHDSGHADRKYYVYAHLDPSGCTVKATEELGGQWKGEPFYIGKGTGGRAYDMSRNQGHGKKIKEVLRKGYPEKSIPFIISDGLYEHEALSLESKLIYFFKTIYEDPKNGVLLNLDEGKRPEFKGVIGEIP